MKADDSLTDIVYSDDSPLGFAPLHRGQKMLFRDAETGNVAAEY